LSSTDGHWVCGDSSPCASSGTPTDPNELKLKAKQRADAAKFLAEVKAFFAKAEAEFHQFQEKNHKQLDSFNSDFGFGRSHCSGGSVGDCITALGEAATAVVAAFGASESKGVSVYRILGEGGETIYVGITNNLERRAGEHGAVLQEIIGGLSRADARAVEQRLINEYGLSKEGGTLLNKINSIAKKNPIYGKALVRGEQLLRSAGFRLARTTI
jgi:uncharacterized protein with PIN domain